MKQTTNYNLNKIELDDSPSNIETINPNWDKIDTEMKRLEDEKATKVEVNDGLARKADADSYLPLVGGTMSGDIFFDKNGTYKARLVTINGNGAFFEVYDANGYKSRILCRFPNHPEKGGWVEIDANDGTNVTQVIIKPNGQVLIGGKNVVRSINGVNADASGNVVSMVGLEVVRYEE